MFNGHLNFRKKPRPKRNRSQLTPGYRKIKHLSKRGKSNLRARKMKKIKRMQKASLPARRKGNQLLRSAEPLDPVKLKTMNLKIKENGLRRQAKGNQRAEIAARQKLLLSMRQRLSQNHNL